MRINKAVELLEQRQPVYFEFVDADSAGGYEGGRGLAQTWADYKKDPKAATDAAVKHKPELNHKLVLGQATGNIQLMDSPNTTGKVVGWHSDKDWDDTIAQLRQLGSLKSDKPATAYYTNEFVPK